ncbi:MAG: N4-gp56 family major capsid protein [Patescibacteria group bacterium]|nr:N4-gp56 family major capsid protein [Patescibacteria group bacterium]
MGNAITTSNPVDFTNRILSYYNKQLLKALEFNLRLTNYGRAQAVPKSSGFNGIRFFRPRKANRSGVQSLTEATPPANLTEVAVGYIDIKLKQRGALSKISDIVTATDLLDTLDVYSKTLGADAALDLESVCWHSICSQAGLADSDGTPNPIPAGQKTLNGSNTLFERFAGVTNTGVSTTDYDTFRVAPVANGVMTRAAHLGCMTQMKINGVPMVGGQYPVIIPSPVLMDMRKDTTWTNTAQFNPDKLLFPWAQFTLDGGVFVEAMQPGSLFTENAALASGAGYGQHDPTANLTASLGAAGAIYSTLYLGADAFGIPKMVGDAGSDPATPSLRIVKNPDSGNPLGQFIFVGWKSFYMAALLWTSEASDVPHVVQLRTRTSFY